MIRAVISDFGGVLTTPLAGSFARFAERSGIGIEELGEAMATILARDGAHPLYELECGRMTEVDFVAGLQQTMSAAVGREVAFVDFSEALWAGLAPNEPMISLMASLRSEGYKMGLLTNNVREWEHRWRAMAPIEEIFEVVVDSAFVGMRKPDPEIYELTVSRLGVPAEECLFVDDLKRNCEAAEAAGMTAIVYRDAQQAAAEIRAALNGGDEPPDHPSHSNR